MSLIIGENYDLALNNAYENYQTAYAYMAERETNLETILKNSNPASIHYDPPLNVTEIIYRIVVQLRYINSLQKIHKYAKLNEEQKKYILAGKKAYRVIKTYKYTVGTFDTIHKIANKFDVGVEDIMDYNNFDSDDLNAGDIIDIPITTNPEQTRFYENPVYTGHIGAAALGTDIENSPTLDTETNDIKILENGLTFEQGLLNLINTQRGHYPGSSEYGLDLEDLEKHDKDTREAILGVRIRTALKLDTRIESVLKVAVKRQANGYKINVVIKTINEITAEEFGDLYIL